MKTLFPTNLTPLQWNTFKADGFEKPVTGTIFREDIPAKNGMPLGGIDTGCIDFETTGLWGLMSIFNSLTPRRGPLNFPALGFTAGEKTYLCASSGVPRVIPAKKVHYWGHYPVADVEFEHAGPVQAGLRAWSPFLPGRLRESMLPVAVFEVRLRNTSLEAVSGRVALSFPGPDRSELRYAKIVREPLSTPQFEGIFVRGDGGFGPTFDKWNATTAANYLLGVIGGKDVVAEPFLGWNAESWKNLGHNPRPLEEEHDQAGVGLSAGYSLQSGEECVVRFVLAWHAPYWFASGIPSGGGNYYHHMYAKEWASAREAAEYVGTHHVALLKSVLAWQQEIYQDKTLPDFLQDALINHLHLITETSIWAQAEDEIGAWARPEDGLFSMNECPRSCPQLSCTPCNFYGDLPLSYFFPQAALSTLRAYKQYQYPSGQIPFTFGGVTGLSGTWEPARPQGGYQWALDGCCLLDMVDKLWSVSGDRSVLDEFYDMCKKVTEFTMNQRPAYGDQQIISMPEGNKTQDWYEFAPFYGLTSHIGGVRLAQLRLMAKMAEAKGDKEYAQCCLDRYEKGKRILDETMWRGSHYGMYHEPETGKRSDMIMAYQLDGEWIARFHGAGTVFDPERARIVLETVGKMNFHPETNPQGAVVFVHPDGRRPSDAETGYWTGYGTHAPGNYILAMTDLYFGNRDRALHLLERTLTAQMHTMRGPWDMAILYRTDNGQRIFGNDYNQNMMIWSLPAVLEGGDLTAPCQQGGLVERIINAGKEAK